MTKVSASAARKESNARKILGFGISVVMIFARMLGKKESKLSGEGYRRRRMFFKISSVKK
jgi:hypothetical protein